MNSQSNIGYTGIVELFNGNRRVCIKNKGTEELFNLIAQLLQHSDNKTKFLPRFIDIGEGPDPDSDITDIIEHSSLSSMMKIYSRDLDFQHPGSVVYKATLYKASLKTITSSKTYKIGLYSEEKKLLAIVDIAGSEINSLFTETSATQALIKWTLSFENQKIQEASTDNSIEMQTT